MSLVVEETRDKDIERVVALFCEDGGNPYGWSESKWQHYYRDYPDGKPVSLVAKLDGKVVGHYGMLPVQIGNIPAMLGVHAYVAKAQRGLTVISALMKEVDGLCRSHSFGLICGFANPRFSQVKSTIFGWSTVCWLGFHVGISCDNYLVDNERHFCFNYSSAWYKWRFGELRDYYISEFSETTGETRLQLLKCRDANALGDSNRVECWSPIATFLQKQRDRFCQPFSLKLYDSRLADSGILQHENWRLDMGDSDTFQYQDAGTLHD